MVSIATSLSHSPFAFSLTRNNNRKKGEYSIIDQNENFSTKVVANSCTVLSVAEETQQTATGTVNHPQYTYYRTIHCSVAIPHNLGVMTMHFVKKKSVGMLIIIVFAQSTNLLQKAGVRRPIKVNRVCKTLLYSTKAQHLLKAKVFLYLLRISLLLGL